MGRSTEGGNLASAKSQMNNGAGGGAVSRQQLGSEVSWGWIPQLPSAFGGLKPWPTFSLTLHER